MIPDEMHLDSSSPDDRLLCQYILVVKVVLEGIVGLPGFRDRTVLELVRGVKAYLNVEAGVTRGELPWSGARVLKASVAYRRARRQFRKARHAVGLLRRDGLSALKGETAAKALRKPEERQGVVNPRNIVWIFGSGRTGSTWLARMMGEIEGQRVWFEPWVGAFFDPANVRIDRQGKHFILSPQYKKIWLESIRRFVLDGANARFPRLEEKEYLVIKEPGGSGGARLLMEALPQSRIVLLVRDPRDVVASWMDAKKPGSWQNEQRSVGRGQTDERREAAAKRVAKRYLQNVGEAKRAYDEHTGYKTLVRYEELRADTTGTMRRMYSELGIPVNEEELSRVVERHSWEAIPEEKKGEGKFYRKASSGGWREDLTPGQVEEVEKITAPLLEELYKE